MNFGPHILTLLESPRAGVHDPKILWAKVQKRRRYGDGGKNWKTPTFEKSQIFRSKNTSDLKGKHLRPKRLFSRNKKIGGGADPPDPKIFFQKKIRFFKRPLEKTHFRKNKFLGVGASLDPQIWGPLNFRLFVNIWTLCENFVSIGKDKLELQASEILMQCNGWPNRLGLFSRKIGQKRQFWGSSPKTVTPSGKVSGQTLFALDQAILW